MKQIIVITRDQPGEMAQIAELLAARDINIEDLDADTEGSTAVIHLVVDRYDEALRALRDEGFQAISEDALVIRLEDRPGALAAVARRFSSASINVRSMHIIRRENGAVWVSLVSSDNAAATELVRDVLVSRTQA
ncbi:MAG: ACT domain-containing protein [Verrucomicrobiales bacterium]|nr:ACT domain-containing protein [Verrucomicrobiales bacterium]